MDEQPDGGNVVGKLFGEGQGFSDQARTALAEGTVEPLNMVGLAAVFVDMMECVRVVAS